MSSDEELEEAYANIEVNFDESETEEEESLGSTANNGRKKETERGQYLQRGDNTDR